MKRPDETSRIIPILLSGGSGRRLWPLSRHSRPKQFLPLDSEGSLFRQALNRLRAPIFDPRPIVVALEDHRFLVAEELREAGIEADILIEPQARNTCAAIAAGALLAERRRSAGIVLAAAVDHRIADASGFARTIARGVAAAKAGRIVAFGAAPVRADSGQGYLLARAGRSGVADLAGFVEKPSRGAVVELLGAGYLANSGYYLSSAKTLRDEIGEGQPELLDAVQSALCGARLDLDFLRLAPNPYRKAPNISFDRAVMEQTERASVVRAGFTWTDIDDWDSVREGGDANGNVAVGDVVLRDCAGNLVHSQGRLTAMIGVRNMIVASTRDCLLIAPLAHAASVGELVAGLEAEGRSEVDEALQIFRPWGNYERLDIGAGYQVKRIVVNPGGVLSLQRHGHRAEHWVVVSGRPEITVGTHVRTLEPNQSAYVPLGAVHRLANPGAEPVVLIEVQTGDYLGEDDIERLEDHYNRLEPA